MAGFFISNPLRIASSLFCKIVALPLGRRRLQRRWGILQWRGKRLDLAEETFIGLCKDACAPLRIMAGARAE